MADKTRRIALMVRMRLGSSRLPRKMLFKLGDETLASLCLKKTREAANALDIPCYAYICPEEVELYDIAKGIMPIIDRDMASA